MILRGPLVEGVDYQKRCKNKRGVLKWSCMAIIYLRSLVWLFWTKKEDRDSIKSGIKRIIKKESINSVYKISLLYMCLPMFNKYICVNKLMTCIVINWLILNIHLMVRKKRRWEEIVNMIQDGDKCVTLCLEQVLTNFDIKVWR